MYNTRISPFTVCLVFLFFLLSSPKPHVPPPSNSDRLFSYLVEAGSYQHWIILNLSLFCTKNNPHPHSRKVIQEHEYLEEYCIN